MKACGICGHPKPCPTHTRPPRSHSRAYQQQARRIAATATQCCLCGEGPRPGDPFTAEHVDGYRHTGHNTPLAAAHKSCQSRQGAAVTNAA